MSEVAEENQTSSENVETKVEETQTVTVEATYTKEQILKSKRYREKRDLVNALLANGKTYTLKNVDEMIGNFMKGEVK